MKFTYQEFSKLLTESKYQFNLKTKDSIYFITPKDYDAFNEHGFVAHNEVNGNIDILHYKEIVQIIIDSKKINYE